MGNTQRLAVADFPSAGLGGRLGKGTSVRGSFRNGSGRAMAGIYSTQGQDNKSQCQFSVEAEKRWQVTERGPFGAGCLSSKMNCCCFASRLRE